MCRDEMSKRDAISERPYIESTEAHLNATYVLRTVHPCRYPCLRVCRGGGGDADTEILEDAAEELKVCKLNCIDTDEVAKFDDDELVLPRGVAGTEHVFILLGGKKRRG